MPFSKLFLPQSNKPPHRVSFTRISFELWQFLTILSFIFSFSSFTVYTTTLQPKMYQKEYLFLDKQKSLIFNQYETLNTNSSNIDATKEYKSESVCREGVQTINFDKSQFDKKISQNIEISQILFKINQQNQLELPSLLIPSNLNRLTDLVQYYNGQWKSYYEEQLFMQQKIFDSQQTASLICQNWPNVEEEVRIFKDITREFNDHHSPLEKEYTAHMDSFLVEIQQKLDTTNEIGNFKSESNKINFDHFNSLFTTTLDEKNMQEIEKSLKETRSEIKNSFIGLEKWQISSNKETKSNLVNKVVWVYKTPQN